MALGYTGKPYDSATGLYNYGYRDYAPVQARFTTVDPIRDGSNWMAYVNNDPVNYLDPFGLSASDALSHVENILTPNTFGYSAIGALAKIADEVSPVLKNIGTYGTGLSIVAIGVDAIQLAKDPTASRVADVVVDSVGFLGAPGFAISTVITLARKTAPVIAQGARDIENKIIDFVANGIAGIPNFSELIRRR